MHPLISIIMPVYQVKAYLSQAISSVLSQTLRDFELILVDDGSTDGSGIFCDQAAQQDMRIRVIHQENKGLSAARNAGIDLARGQWLFFIDSDDFLFPNCLEKLFSSAKTTHADIVLCSVCKMDASATPLKSQWSPLSFQTLTSAEALQHISDPHFLVAWNKLYRREIFATLRYPEGKWNEDVALSVALYNTAASIVTLPDRLYAYRQSPNSIMHQRKTLRHLDEADAFAQCIQQLCALQVVDALPKLESYQYYAIDNVWRQLSPPDRKSPKLRHALQQHRHTLRLLFRHGRLRPRVMIRSAVLHSICALRRFL